MKQFFLTSHFLSYYPPPAPLSIVFPPFSLFPCFLPSLSLVVAFCMLPSSVIVCPLCPCSEARELELFIFHCSLFSLSSLLLSSVSELLLLLSFFCPSTLSPLFLKPYFLDVYIFSTLSLSFSPLLRPIPKMKWIKLIQNPDSLLFLL